MHIRKLLKLCSLFSILAASAPAAVVLQPLANRPFTFSVQPTTGPTIIEASSNLVNWVAIKTNALSTLGFTFTDNQSLSLPQRFYRLRPLAPALSNLSLATNSVFMPSEGFNTLQYAPDGKLGLIVWNGLNLVYREKVGSSWTENVLGAFGKVYTPGITEEYRFQPHASLLFDSQSRAHVLLVSGASISHYVQQANGTFLASTPISLAGVGSSFSLFSAAIGPNDTLHFAMIPAQPSPPLWYGSNLGGTWQWTVVTNLAGDPRGFLKQSYAPRWFSMAVDSSNRAHLTFCPEFVIGRTPEGYARPYDALYYASNRGGSWTTEKIADVADGSGDAGAGASIAIGPDNQPAIAAWYNERFPTGSSLFCLLNYYHRDASGWSQQLVTSTSAGYLAGDGDKGSGFAPYLRFDSLGRPNIAFCDDAAEHFATTGQNEYAGNLRHAYFNGSQWVIRTIYSQTDALQGQLIYPAMAISGNELSFMGLVRDTAWIQPNYRIANSSYELFLVQTTF